MAEYRFEADRLGLAEMFASPMMGDAMLDAAEIIAGNVRAAAPVSTGSYRATVKAKRGDMVDGAPFAKVSTIDWAWHLVEYGTATNPAYRPMFNGVQAAGVDWRDEGPAA